MGSRLFKQTYYLLDYVVQLRQIWRDDQIETHAAQSHIHTEMGRELPSNKST